MGGTPFLANSENVADLDDSFRNRRSPTVTYHVGEITVKRHTRRNDICGRNVIVPARRPAAINTVTRTFFQFRTKVHMRGRRRETENKNQWESVCKNDKKRYERWT